MVSMTELSAIHGSEESAQRLAGRRAAETRLKAYGILAICIAGLALVALLWSVVGNASGALTQNFTTLPVTLSAEKIDPDNTRDPKVIAKANFDGLTKDVLKEVFPYVTDRRERRQLYDMVSSGANFELRRHVMANPDLIGQTIDYEFMSSDVLDLYFKGDYEH